MTLKITMNQLSVDTFIKNLVGLQSIVLNAGLEAIDALSTLIEIRSRAMTPSDTGALVDSLYREVEMNSTSIQANIGYGGSYAKLNPKTFEWSDGYAIEVHETNRISAASASRGASWKFLEKAVISVNPIFMPYLQAYLKTALSGGSDKALRNAISRAYQNIMSKNRR